MSWYNFVSKDKGRNGVGGQYRTTAPFADPERGDQSASNRVKEQLQCYILAYANSIRNVTRCLQYTMLYSGLCTAAKTRVIR